MIEKLKILFNMPNAIPQELATHVIIYLRKSRKDMEFVKDESIEKTLERHETMLQDYALSLFGCKIPENNIYREVVSGDTITDRPKMQEVLKLIELDDIKAVLCIEIERLARGNSIDQGIIAEKFQLTNTKIITPQKLFDLDDEFDMSYFEEGLHQSRKFLQYIKKILNRGREQTSREGKFVGSTPPFGYDKMKIKNEKGFTLVKNKDNEIVRKLFDLFLYENLGTTEVAKKMNAMGFLSPAGLPWNGNIVRRILKRSEVYTGYILWNRRKGVKKYVNGEVKTVKPINEDCIKVKGLHEPTITEEEYKMVQEKLKKTSIKTVKNGYEMKNPLAGLVKCALCGHNMIRRAYYVSCVSSGYIHKDTLICNTINCKNVSCDLDLVESKVLEYLKIKLKDFENILINYQTESADFKEEYEKEKRALNNKLSNINLQKQKCCEFLETGTYDEETFTTRINKLNEEIKTTNKLLKELEEKMKTEEKARYEKAIPILKNCLELYDKASIKQKNQLLSSIIEVIIYKKTKKGGRWNEKDRISFELEIKLKI